MTLSIDDIASSNILDASNSRRRAFNSIAGWNGESYTNPIKYYIHDNTGPVNFEILNNNYAYAISDDEEKFINDTFKQIDKYIDLNFERVYSASEATIDVYKTITAGGTWGYAGWYWWLAPYDYDVEVEWTPLENSGPKLKDYPTLSSSVGYYIMHEISHALGLQHDLAKGNFDPSDSRYNITDTFMSYNYSGYLTNSLSYTSLDIKALKTIWGENFAPTDISLSSTSFNENISSKSVLATLSTTDEDDYDSHTYAFISGIGDSDNNLFTIEESILKINSSPDYENKSSYSIRIKATDRGGLFYEEVITLGVNDLLETGNVIGIINETYSQHSKGFSSISGSSPITVTKIEVGKNTNLDSIKDYDGNLHAGDTSDATPSSYKYQGLLDVNGDGVFEAIFTNKVSKRWVTAKVDSFTGQVDFDDNGAGGTTRVVGIYEDPLIAEGSNNGGFLSDGVTPAPANFGVSEEERYIELNGEIIDRLALNSQVRFQNDLDIDNLSAKHSGDYDSDGVREVYWKTNDGTAFLRALMHDDGNIRYANYQSEDQMYSYLTAQGHTEIISDIV